MAKNVKKLSDEKLLCKASSEAIEFIKAIRDDKPQPATPYTDEAKRRGMTIQISRNLIRRVLNGEFG